MIKREASKFGDAVMTRNQGYGYVLRFLREVARYMADDQTDSIDELALSWVAEVAAPKDLDSDTLRSLAKRAGFIAFLQEDDTPQYRRFSHSNLFNHFLGMEIIDAIVRKDVPKCVRRNVLGADFLSIFCDLSLNMSLQESERIRKFYDSASELLQNYPWSDRGAHNIGSLLITLLSSMEYEGSLVLRNIQADEALIRGTTSAATIHDAGISQLDIQGANVETLEFINSHITTLTVDELTHVSPSIPLPSQIQYNRLQSDRSKVISSREGIDGWLQAHGRVVSTGDTVGEEAGMVPKELLNHPMRRLLRRACRSRSFWTPEGSTNYFEKFTRDPWWSSLLALMQKHNLVKEETITASGTNSRFIHIKQPIRILAEDRDDENVRSFYEALVAVMRETA